MAAPDLVVRGEQVVTPEGVRPASIHVVGGTIQRVASFDEVGSPKELVDAGELLVLPGLVDTHVHVNEPGRTEWEGFETATRAAAAGGVTTIVDMPLNSIPPTTSVAALESKRAAAAGKCFVDVGFWGGAVPGNMGSLRALHDSGVFGFKCFLVPSGVEEFPPLDAASLRDAMAELASMGALLLVHAELPGPIDAAARELSGSDPRAFATYLRSRPPEAEVEAVRLMAEASRTTGCRAHVLHVSSAEALDVLRDARAGGVSLTAETCPHYLTFAAEDVPAGATVYKCAPPIRVRSNQDRLWEGLRDRALDAVVSDHSPCPPELKRPDTGDFLRAWGGIASLQLGLPVVWSSARRRGISIEAQVQWMAVATARICGLMQKGSIAAGLDADLVLFDPDRRWVVEPDALEHRHRVTPYAGMALDGAVVATYLRGVEVYREGRFASAPTGRFLERGSA
ncbi:MAG: allantoinase AllB [Actinomycetota bacterium]|nr:allantoinase AllB [Actinomycetota bacterium]